MTDPTSPDQAPPNPQGPPDPTAAELDPERIIAEQFRRARAHLGHIAPGLVDFLRLPRQSISVNLPIEMDDGSIQSFAAHRVLQAPLSSDAPARSPQASAAPASPRPRR